MAAYTVDRIDEGIAVLITLACDDKLRIRAAELPAGTKEGDVVRYHDGSWFLDREETWRRKDGVAAILKRLISRFKDRS